MVLYARLVEALASLHDAGIAHLDIQPANVLLTREGPRLIDYGVAAADPSNTPLGTPGYMSPEQRRGHDTGLPSDVHSLALTLRYALGDNDAGMRLRLLLAVCLKDDPASRLTTLELKEQLAALVNEIERPETVLLPGGIRNAIHEVAITAESYPAAAPERRRFLVAAGVGAGVAAAGGSPLYKWIAALVEPSPAHSSPNGPRTTSPPSTDPPIEPVKVEFAITGDGTLESLDYSVNGHATEVRQLALPWRETVHVPPRGTGSVDFGLRMTIASGTIRYRVTVDGSKQADDHQPRSVGSFPVTYPFSVEFGGAATTARPLPRGRD